MFIYIKVKIFVRFDQVSSIYVLCFDYVFLLYNRDFTS